MSDKSQQRTITTADPQRSVPERQPSPGDPLNEQAYQRLRWGLTDGTYRPGDKLSIRRLAGMLGTSAMPVREALTRLA